MAILNQYGTPFEKEDVALTDDDKKIFKVLTLWDKGTTEYNPFWKKLLQVERVLADEPWTEDELAFAQKQNRDLLSIPILRVNEMHVDGLQRTTRAEFRVNPVDRKADPELADITSKILNGIAYNNRMDVCDSLIFNDGQNGIGSWHVYEKFDEDELGEVIVERADRFSVIYDWEHQDPHMKDCRFVVVTKYLTADELKLRFPDKMKDVDFTRERYNEWWNDMGSMMKTLSIAGQLVDYENGLYAVLELHERVKTTQLMIIDSQSGQTLGAFELGKERVKDFNNVVPGMHIAQRTKTYMKITRVLPYCNILLSEEKEDYTTYPYIPYLSRRRGDTRIPKCSSYNYGLLGLQRETNMRHSNQQEFIIRSIRGGWWVYNDDTEMLQQLNEHGHKINHPFLVRGGPGSEPQRIAPENIMQGLQYLEEGAVEMFTMVTGLHLQPMGKTEFSGESGKHNESVRKQSQITIYPMLEDFDSQRTLAGEAMLERTAAQLTVPRVLQITGSDGTSDVIFASEELINNLKSVQRFDIRITEGPYASLLKEEQYNLKLTTLDIVTKTYGPSVVLPGDFMRGTNLPDADEMADLMDARWEAQIAANQAAEELARATNQQQPQSQGAQQ